MNRVVPFVLFLFASATVPAVAGVAAGLAMLVFCLAALCVLAGARPQAERLFGAWALLLGAALAAPAIRGAALNAWESPGVRALAVGLVVLAVLVLAVRLWAAGEAAKSKVAPVRRARLAERAAVVDPAPPRRSVGRASSDDELGLFEDRRG